MVSRAEGDASTTVVVADPSPRELEDARSVHVLAFTSRDELLLVESEGDFSLDEWQRAYDAARKICCGREGGTGTDMVLDGDGRDGPDMRHFLQATMEAKVAEDLWWQKK